MLASFAQMYKLMIRPNRMRLIVMTFGKMDSEEYGKASGSSGIRFQCILSAPPEKIAILLPGRQNALCYQGKNTSIKAFEPKTMEEVGWGIKTVLDRLLDRYERASPLKMSFEKEDHD